MNLRAPLFMLGLALALALVLVAAGAGLARGGPVAPSPSAPVPAEADAAVGQLVLTTCGGCHGLETLSHNPQDAAGWTKTVALMQQLGAQVNPNDRAALIAYLARHFGPQP
jgi:cytochrome c2